MSKKEFLSSLYEDRTPEIKEDCRWVSLKISREFRKKIHQKFNFSGVNTNESSNELCCEFFLNKKLDIVQTGMPLDLKYREIHEKDLKKVKEELYYGKRFVDISTSLHLINKAKLTKQPIPTMNDDCLLYTSPSPRD